MQSTLHIKIEIYLTNVIGRSKTILTNGIFCIFCRYLAICHPFKHIEFVGLKVSIAIASTYIYSFIAHCFCVVQVKKLSKRLPNQVSISNLRTKQEPINSNGSDGKRKISDRIFFLLVAS